VLPAVEVIDSRYKDFKFDLKSVVADNASAPAALSPAGAWPRPRSVDLRTLGVVMEKNGEVVAAGAGAAVLGHPAAAVAMLANHLGRRGQEIPAGTRSETHVVYNCGRADDAAVVERLRKLAASILRRCSPEEIVGAGNGDLRLVCAWPYGEVYVLQALWQRLGIDQVIRAQAQSRRLGFDVERALFAMVANRACAPCSKLYCWEQWLKEEVNIPGTQGLSLQHLYRAMDFLEANKEPIEREIFHRVADLLNLDVEVLFYDTTSLHFEIDLDDEGVGPDDLVHGSLAAGRKTYRAPRKRGLSKNGRGDAPQIVVGMAVTREGFPVRHWVFPGNTVDVTTVAQVKRDLRDWQLTRCLFVGDAGMVSAANFKALAAGGGKYLMCVPLRRGDAMTEQVLARAGRYRTVNERLQIKEVVIGDGERRLRYVLCF
jgi:hypothetical protein